MRRKQAILLTFLTLFSLFISESAFSRDTWNRTFMDVSYDYLEGTITLRCKFYDYRFGPANEDGFIEGCNVQFSNDNVNYENLFYFASSGQGASDRSWVNISNKKEGTILQLTNSVNPQSGTMWPDNENWKLTIMDEGAQVFLMIKWYVGQNYRNVKSIRFNGNWDVNGSYGSDPIDNEVYSVNIPLMSAVNYDSFTFTDSKEVQIKWTKDDNNIVDQLSKLNLVNSSNNNVLASTDIKSSKEGTLIIPQSAFMNTCLLQNKYLDFFTESSFFDIPAFTHPLTFTGNFSPITNKMILNWTIDQAIGSNIEKCDFLIQRSTKSDFSEELIDVAKVAYDPNLTAYQYEESLKDVTSLRKTMYYRIKRDYGGFTWKAGITVTTTLSHASIDPQNLILELVDNNKAKLTWAVSGVWSDGSTFIITRINETTKVTADIVLDKEDYYKGEYIDDFIKVCNRYSYKLQVIPGDNSFIKVQTASTSNSILPSDIGIVKDIQVSKGYFADRIELEWSSVGDFDYFVVRRKPYDSNESFRQIAQVSGSNASEFYQTDDMKAEPGVYYTYQIFGVVQCDNDIKATKDTLTDIGFRSPTGNVYGRITYENGQAVAGAEVLLESDNQSFGKSVLFNGTNSYLQVNNPFNLNSEFTIQAWVAPDKAALPSGVIMSKKDEFDLGFTPDGKLYFTIGSTTLETPYPIKDGVAYNHVSVSYKANTLQIYINGVSVAFKADVLKPETTTNLLLIGKNSVGQFYKGNLDEVRIWDIALTPEEILRDYTRFLYGGEEGLKAYWRFDESIQNAFYDLSYRNSKYNENHGSVFNAIKDNVVIPTNQQLALKGITDNVGAYMVTGIPYSGNGTLYTLIPRYGTHQFDPNQQQRLIANGSLSHTCDFIDKSSFEVTGRVYYSGGNVPVRGVSFQIDGLPSTKNNKVVETATDGLFTIRVPVGYHEVKAVKSNHVFENDGLIVDSEGKNLNYQTALDGIILYDSTRVKFIGRVAGGAVQEEYPLGHSLSKNNLGAKEVITLVLPGYPGNDISKTDKIEEFTHFLPSNKSGKTPYKNTVKYSQSSVEIYPNAVTGEFIAMLIPENFNVTTVNVTGEKYGNILPDGKPVNLDLTQKFIDLVSSNKYSETTSDPSNPDITTTVNFSDTVKYNASYKFIKRFNPEFTIKQLLGSKEVDYYGDTTVVINDLYGKLDTIKVYTPESGYLFNNPVFRQKNKYSFRIKAFESYPFYDIDGNQTATDNVATTDGLMSFTNGMLDNAPIQDTISLNDKGTAVYNFICGKPEIISIDGLKRFNASLKIGETTLAWPSRIDALVVGGVSTGNTFITAGPNVINAVLRDPPGTESYSFLEAGTTFEKTSYYVAGFSFDQEIGAQVEMSANVVILTGIGVATQQETTIVNKNKFMGVLSENYVKENGKITTITSTNSWQTSSAPEWVGADADVYIGNSTNIITGTMITITPILKKNLKSTDKIIVDTSDPNGYCFIRGEALGLGVTFETTFAYPQSHIETVLIPKFKELKSQILMPKTTTEADAKQLANATFKQVYVSKLSSDDKKFGLLNTDDQFGNAKSSIINYDDGPSYKIYYPEKNKDGSKFITTNDTILILDQSIKNWEKAIANNEKAKLLATGGKNYSFTGGAKISNSYSYSTTDHIQTTFEFVVGFKNEAAGGAFFNKAGTKWIVNTTSVTKQGRVGATDNTYSSTFGFNFNDNLNDYLSVDVKHVTNKGNFSSIMQSVEADYDKYTADKEYDEYVFITRAGATSCPYEAGYKTKYYKKGTIIDQPTARIEVPIIDVENPVVTNVPANRNATFNLLLKNGSETKADAWYRLSLLEETNPYGATFSMDGASVASGHTLFISASDVPVKKVLVVGKGTAMDYENLQLVLESICDGSAVDTLTISAHFSPSCSDVNISYPTNAWTLNAETKNVTADGRYFLPIKLDNFDVNFANFDHIKIQYKPSAASDAEWVTLKSFYADADKMAQAQGEKAMISGSTINYDFILGDLPDQRYDICAVSVCKVLNDEIQTVSNIVKGIKDTYRPRLFGSAQPASGILGIDDEIRLNFNESIAQGLLVADNFEVKGIRNGTKTNHSAAVKFDGIQDYLATEIERNFAGKDITVEMSLLVDKRGASTVFSHGNINESFEFGFTNDNKLQVKVGSEVITSPEPLNFKPGEWEHIAVSYHTGEQPKLTAYYNYVEVINQQIGTAYKGIGNYEIGRSIAGNNYFTGKIHELRVWNKDLTLTSLTKNSGVELAGNELGLLSYYPMTEGEGSVVLDKARGMNALMKAEWYMNRIGLAAQFNQNSYLKLSTGALPISIDQDYTIEFWFKGVPGQTNATLVSNGRGDNQEFDGSKKLFFIGFDENGKLVLRNNGIEILTDGSYLDNEWHHYALAVNRNMNKGYIYIDGDQKNFFDAADLGSITASYMYLGARRWSNIDDPSSENIDMFYQGFLDEFRVWNTFKTQTLINQENCNRLTGSEMALLAYYPFETYIDQIGLKEMVFSVADQADRGTTGIVIPDAQIKDVVKTNDVGKVKDPGAEGSISVNYVVNNDALIIQPVASNGWDDFEQRIVSFKVNNVRDLNGNMISSPISWSAFIDRNQLRWSDDTFDISKMENDPLEFTLSISNVGGTVRRYSIENAPSWMKIEPSSGSINPKTTLQIKFTVDRALNIGMYDEVIYLVNENNVSRALSLSVTVKGEKPNWTVNPKDFNYNMSVYGQLKINNIFSVDKEDMLAAFIDGKCVGVANYSYQANIDSWYSFLTVYSNEKQKNGVEFRIWDNSTGKIYLAKTDKEITFLNNAILGSPDEPIIFNGLEMLYQNITLGKGWNWMSFNLYNSSLSNVKQTLLNGTWRSGDEVKDHISFDSYSTQYSWVGTLSQNGGFNNTSMYFINSSVEQTLSTSGTRVDMKTNPITVKPNWNYIGYLPAVNMTVLEALAGYNAEKGDVIKSQTEFSMYSLNKGWVGSLTYLEPGKGYMLYRSPAAQQVNFIYPSISGSLVNNVSKQKTRSAFDLADSYINPMFAENMSVIAVADQEFEMKATDKIKAYVENTLRGISNVVFSNAEGKPVNYISVAGEKEAPVTFVVERNGKIIAQTDPVINYRSNAVYGTVERPIILKFRHTSDNLNVYPSPFQTEVNITLSDPQANEIEIAVYDVNGRLIMKRDKELISNGLFQTTWDGSMAGGVNCEKGIYLILITIDGQTTISKVEKQ